MTKLNPNQFFGTDDLSGLQSRDYPGPIGDLEFRPGGESDERVNEIMESARESGIREPLKVFKDTMPPTLQDGHHRYVAAKRLGIPVPVEGYY